MLLVIDMQPGFKTSLQVKDQVRDEVEKAAKKKEEIIFLEYGQRFRGDKLFGQPYRSTHKEIRDAAKGTKTKQVKKTRDDGSEAVLKHLRKARRIRVCGVNGDACVLATVEGLLAKLPGLQIDVIERAVGWNPCCANTRFKNWSGIPVNIVRA